MFGGDNEIGNMLQEAVKLKSAQMGEKRKRYEVWPFFVQHTLFHGEKDDFKAWRQMPFDEKLEVSERLKEEGNKLYGKGAYSDAVDKYEEAGSLVYYCYSTDPGWRKNNRGIDDDVLVLVDDAGSNEQEAAQQRRLRVTCAVNIAACKLQLQKYDEVIVACNYALELDPKNVKALYRRAEARVRPTRSTGYDRDLAIKDLAKAHSIEPENAVVRKLLKEEREQRKVQSEKDKGTFGNMFDRGQIYDTVSMGTGSPGASATTFAPVASDTAKSSSAQGGDEEDTLEKRTADAELLRDLYMRNGKEEEAKELNEKIQVAKKALRQRDKPPRLDWENPTQEMIEDARKHDLDLTDPVVVRELMRMQREGLDSQPPTFEEDSSEHQADAVSEAVIPWSRYVVLLASMAAAWRILDAGLCSRIVVWTWRFLLGRAFVGAGTNEDSDAEEARGSLFASAYRHLTAAFGGDADDADL